MTREKIEKLIRLAIDPAASEPESDNAAVMLFRSLRQSGVTYQRLVDSLGVTVSTVTITLVRPPAKWEPVRMTFGKYRGRKLRDVCRRDPEYVKWILQHMSNLPAAIRSEAEDWVNA